MKCDSYFELYYPDDNIGCAYWKSGQYFYRQYENESKPKRISVVEYMSAYGEYHGI